MRAPMNRRSKWPIVLGSIFGVIVVAVVIGLFVLDSVLTNVAHEQARKFGKQIGRTIKIDSVAVKLFTGLGVRVSGVEVGPASGEKQPLVSLERVEVKAALLKAVFSKGKEVEIKSAEMSGLTVNVIKGEDGKTNLEHLQETLAEEKKPEPAPKKADDKPADLSAIRVDHVALLEGHVRFIDNSGGGAKQLEVQHLSIVVNDLAAGKPLDVVIKAAILATQENFQLQLHAAPLPPTLTPTPEKVVIKVSPIDLAPLAPFVPSSVGLQAGHFDADFTAELGAAVPGGQGKTSLKGALHALGLKFAGAEGGKALDVTLDMNIDADAAAGDVDIHKLALNLGPAGFDGSGKASGLKSAQPRVEGLKIASHDLDPEKLATLYPPLRKQLGGQVSGPIGVSVQAAGTQANQQLEVRLDFTPVKLAIPQQLSKAAGGKMLIVAHVKGAAASNGTLAFDADLDLSGVDLRPGQSLDKKPGDALSLFIDGTKSGGEKPGAPMKVALSKLTAKVIDATFTGSASVEMAGVKPDATTAFSAQLRSPRVDVDRLLIESTKKKEEKPPPDPAAFKGLSGEASVKIDSLRVKKQEMKSVVADVTVKDDDVLVKTASLEAFAGKIDASGTELKLAHPDEPFHAKLTLQKIDMGQALALVSDKKVLDGKFDGNIALDGKGTEAETIKKTLAGLIQGKLNDGVFHGKDLIASVSGPLASKLPFGLAGKGGQGGSTSLGKVLPFGLQIADGKANLKEPLKVNTPQADLTADGGITLEGNLAMSCTAALSPALVATITGGKAKVDQPIPVKFGLGGPAWKPEVTGLDLGPAVSVILKGAAAGAIGSVLGNTPAGQKAQQILQGGPDAAKAEAQKAAQAQADKARADAEARAKAEADKQKKALEDQAKNKLKGLFGN